MSALLPLDSTVTLMKMGWIVASSSGLRERFNRYLQAHPLQFLNQALLLRLPMPSVKVVAAQLLITCPLLQHMVNDDEDRVADSHQCLFLAHPLDEALIQSFGGDGQGTRRAEADDARGGS